MGRIKGMGRHPSLATTGSHYQPRPEGAEGGSSFRSSERPCCRKGRRAEAMVFCRGRQGGDEEGVGREWNWRDSRATPRMGSPPGPGVEDGVACWLSPCPSHLLHLASPPAEPACPLPCPKSSLKNKAIVCSEHDSHVLNQR